MCGSLFFKIHVRRAGDIPIFTCICVYVFIYVCHASWPNDNRYRPEIRYTHSPRSYLKTDVLFFEKTTLTAASLEKLLCHVGFPHISSIALFHVFFFRQ